MLVRLSRGKFGSSWMAGVGYYILSQTIIRSQGAHSKLKEAVGNDRKGQISVVLYLIAIPLAFVNQLLSDVIYVFVALMWLVPDRRIEQQFKEISREEQS